MHCQTPVRLTAMIRSDVDRGQSTVLPLSGEMPALLCARVEPAVVGHRCRHHGLDRSLVGDVDGHVQGVATGRADQSSRSSPPAASMSATTTRAGRGEGVSRRPPDAAREPVTIATLPSRTPPWSVAIGFTRARRNQRRCHTPSRASRRRGRRSTTLRSTAGVGPVVAVVRIVGGPHEVLHADPVACPCTAKGSRMNVTFQLRRK